MTEPIEDKFFAAHPFLRLIDPIAPALAVVGAVIGAIAFWTLFYWGLTELITGLFR